VPYSFADDGDDCLIIISRQHLGLLDDFERHMEALGLPVTLESPVDVFEEIEFCQSHPVLGPDGWVMCRDPKTSMCKDLYTTKPVDTFAQWNYYRKLMALSGLALTRGLPVMESFYKCLKRGVPEKVKIREEFETGMQWLSIGMSKYDESPEIPPKHVSADTRLSFFKAFDITPDEQRTLEEMYDASTPKYAPFFSHSDNIRIRIKNNKNTVIEQLVSRQC
jgi:hypothetical protein